MKTYMGIIKNMVEYYKKSVDLHYQNKELIRENAFLKDALNKEQDTQFIKYYGKIYKIITTAHFSDIGEADILDINAIYCDEVNENGEG